MNIQFPKPLQSGDTIAITAPSSGVSPEFNTRLDLSIQVLKERGYKVIEGRYVRTQYKNTSADKFLRAQELTEFLSNPEINAIMPPWGGELAMELLELIDFEALKQIPPKWISGFSDLSTLHVPLTTISGWATLHAPNLMELGAKEIDITTEKIWSILESPQHSEIEQYSSDYFQLIGSDWTIEPNARLNLTQPTHWKRLDGSNSSIQFSGRLIGGCLETISRLAGTPFANIPQFCERYKNEDIILYFENSELQPCELTRTLISLKIQGWFKQLSGIMIGRSAASEVNDPNKLNYVDALKKGLSDLTIPIIYDADIGHMPPQISLVNGALATVYFHENSDTLSIKSTIKIYL